MPGFVIANKFRGLNNLLSEAQQKLIWFLQADNVDITDTYGYKLRKGAVLQLALNGHSLWSDNNIMLCRQGTNLKRIYPDLTVATLRTDLSSTPLPMSYLPLLGKVFYSDGRNTGIVENNISRSWGLVVPKMPVVSTIAGTLTRGLYKIVTTYKRNDGQESGASVPTEIELTDDFHAVRVLTEPSMDGTVTGISVYVTMPNGTEFALYQKVSNAINMVDITSVNNLEYPLETQFLSQMPPLSNLTLYNGRIYGAETFNIWYTEAFSYELCRRAKNIIGFEKPVRLIAAMDDGLWVGTEKEIVFLSGANPPFSVGKTIPFGVVEGSCAIDVPGDMFGKDRYGQNLIRGKAAVWGSDQGICIGASGGYFINATEEYFAFPFAVGGFGALRESNELNQFLMFLKDISANNDLYRSFVNEVRTILPEVGINAISS